MKSRLAVVAALAALALAPRVWAQSSGDLLEKGIYTENTVGDLDAAVIIYQKVLDDAKAEPAQKAQAQYRIGLCLMKAHKDAEAVKAFRLILDKYADQKDIAAEAKTRLGRLMTPNPAALMPPGTVLYAEIGSPGHQIEKIVNMLKGTPLANPLAVVGGGRQPATRPGAPGQPKNPGDIMAALLNPSMLNEFKKIRGLAIGIIDLDKMPRGGSVPSVAVIYPGESDVLRGLLQAGLSVAGSPGEPVEGMQTIVLPDGAGACAYDDNVMIVAANAPADRLGWCVKQYKGTTNEPSLATQSKSFSRLTSPEARQKDALTVWVDVPAFYNGLAGRSDHPLGDEPRIQAIAQLCDVQNIEGAVFRLSIDEKNPYLEASVVFKDGHNCLPYELIRTPALTRTGFEGVGSQAIGVLSFALSDANPNGKAAEAATKALGQFTGLDIGRELFANIEQVNVFVLPAGDDPAEAKLARMTSPFGPCVGLAITSHDPAKTQQVFDRLLSAPQKILEAMAGPSGATGRTAQRPPGQYVLHSMPRGEVIIHMAQVGRTTVLALSPRVIQAAQEAAKAKAAMPTTMPPALPAPPPGACKVLTVNVGGALQMVMAMKAGYIPPSAASQPSVRRQMALVQQLCQVLSNTYVQAHTTEAPNEFRLRLSLVNLPPLGELLPLVMQAQ